MVHQSDWYNPSVLKKVRRRLTIATWLVIAMIIYLQHDAVLYLLNQLLY